MESPWTLPELVDEVAARIAALPAPRNGQVRAIPDDRTVRYYATLGLLDRPSAMRGRTALYGARHVAQVVAIKRLQAAGRSLAEIQALWPTLDDATLARMSGVALGAARRRPERAGFWKREPRTSEGAPAGMAGPARTEGGRGEPGVDQNVGGAEESAGAAHGDDVAPVLAEGRAPATAGDERGTGAPAVELRIELSPGVVLSLSVTDESVVMSPADVRELRAAAAPLLAELAFRRLTSSKEGEEP